MPIRRRNAFDDARQTLRLAAIAYAEAVQRTLQFASVAGLASLSEAGQRLQDAAIDFTMIAKLKLASEDKKKAASK